MGCGRRLQGAACRRAAREARRCSGRSAFAAPEPRAVLEQPAPALAVRALPCGGRSPSAGSRGGVCWGDRGRRCGETRVERSFGVQPASSPATQLARISSVRVDGIYREGKIPPRRHSVGVPEVGWPFLLAGRRGLCRRSRHARQSAPFSSEDSGSARHRPRPRITMLKACIHTNVDIIVNVNMNMNTNINDC